jgi:hypothetical protein
MKHQNCTDKNCKNFGKYARYCNHYEVVEKPQATIPSISKNLKEDLKEYKIVREQFLKDNPFCEAGLKCCQVKSSEVHHKRGRGKNLCNVETFLAVCSSCHRIIEENPLFAKANGFSLSRLNKTA